MSVKRLQEFVAKCKEALKYNLEIPVDVKYIFNIWKQSKKNVLIDEDDDNEKLHYPHEVHLVIIFNRKGPPTRSTRGSKIAGWMFFKFDDYGPQFNQITWSDTMVVEYIFMKPLVGFGIEDQKTVAHGVNESVVRDHNSFSVKTQRYFWDRLLKTLSTLLNEPPITRVFFKTMDNDREFDSFMSFGQQHLKFQKKKNLGFLVKSKHLESNVGLTETILKKNTDFYEKRLYGFEWSGSFGKFFGGTVPAHLPPNFWGMQNYLERGNVENLENGSFFGYGVFPFKTIFHFTEVYHPNVKCVIRISQIFTIAVSGDKLEKHYLKFRKSKIADIYSSKNASQTPHVVFIHNETKNLEDAISPKIFPNVLRKYRQLSSITSMGKNSFNFFDLEYRIRNEKTPLDVLHNSRTTTTAPLGITEYLLPESIIKYFVSYDCMYGNTSKYKKITDVISKLFDYFVLDIGNLILYLNSKNLDLDSHKSGKSVIEFASARCYKVETHDSGKYKFAIANGTLVDPRFRKHGLGRFMEERIKKIITLSDKDLRYLILFPVDSAKYFWVTKMKYKPMKNSQHVIKDMRPLLPEDSTHQFILNKYGKELDDESYELFLSLTKNDPKLWVTWAKYDSTGPRLYKINGNDYTFKMAFQGSVDVFPDYSIDFKDVPLVMKAPMGILLVGTNVQDEMDFEQSEFESVCTYFSEDGIHVTRSKISVLVYIKLGTVSLDPGLYVFDCGNKPVSIIRKIIADYNTHRDQPRPIFVFG